MTATETKTPSVTEFKAFMSKRGSGGKLADAVFVAKAFAELERERVDKYVEPIFAKYGFVNKRSGEPLLKSRDLYLAGDTPDVEAKCKEFYDECEVAHRANGFTGKVGNCPALCAENALMMAERALLIAAGEVFGIDGSDIYGKNREKMLDLLLGAAAIKYRKGGK